MKKILKNSLGFLAIMAVVFVFTPVLAKGNPDNKQTQQQVQDQQQMPNLKDALDQAGTTDFSKILEKSGAIDMFSKGGPYTIFAPTNEALGKLSQEDINKLKDNPELLKKTISNHMIRGAITQENESSPDLKAMSGRKVDITKDDMNVYVNGQKIIKGVQYKNGVVYVIDGVIL